MFLSIFVALFVINYFSALYFVFSTINIYIFVQYYFSALSRNIMILHDIENMYTYYYDCKFCIQKKMRGNEIIFVSINFNI